MTENQRFPFGPSADLPLAANDNARTVVAANDNDLRDPGSVSRLAAASLALDLPRRPFLTFLAETIFWFEGRIVWPDGTVLPVTDTLIDDHFPDGSARWVSSFWQCAKTPPRQSAQRRVCWRLRIIRVTLDIIDPD